MTNDRKAELFDRLFWHIADVNAGPEQVHGALRACGLTDQEIVEFAETIKHRQSGKVSEFHTSLESYTSGFMRAVSEYEYKIYRKYLDILESEVFLDFCKIPEYIVEAEKKARIRDLRRRLTETVTADVYTAAVEHLKMALFDAKPYGK